MNRSIGARLRGLVRGEEEEDDIRVHNIEQLVLVNEKQRFIW